MACKARCGDNTVDSKFYCHACIAKKGIFQWCVITHGPESSEDGNKYDAMLSFDETDVELFDGKNAKVIVKKGSPGFIHYKDDAFHIGEIFPVTKDFGREMSGDERKPSKWDIGYQLFPARQYKKAVELAVAVTRDFYKPKTGLNILEEKYVAKVLQDEKLTKLRRSVDPFKLVYEWIKQGHINFKESRVLMGEVFKCQTKH